jgi:hypothetical protein
MAWQYTSAEVTVTSFNNCCISNAMDGIDHEMLWNGSEDDGNVSSEQK